MRYVHFTTIAVSAYVAAFFFTQFVYAQSDYGAIAGFVKDPSAAMVPNAKVVVKNEGNGEERTTLANESGYFVVPNLQPGFYSVTAEASGFKKVSSAHM